MIHHSKGVDLKITDFEFYYAPTYTGMLYVDKTLLCVMKSKKGEARRVEQNYKQEARYTEPMSERSE